MLVRLTTYANLLSECLYDSVESVLSLLAYLFGRSSAHVNCFVLCLSGCSSVCLFVRVFVCLCMRVRSLSASVGCVFVRLFSLFVCLYICRSVCLSVYADCAFVTCSVYVWLRVCAFCRSA